MAEDGNNHISAVPSSDPPRDFANVPAPRDLHPTSDIRFVILEIGKLTTKVDTLNENVGKVYDRLGKVERTIDRVKTGLIVAVSILSIVGTLFWWVIGDRITVAVRNGLLGSTISEEQYQADHANAPPTKLQHQKTSNHD